MLKTLSYIGNKINDSNIGWGVGGSLLLNFHGIIDKPNDIDILVDEIDVSRMNEIVTGLGEAKEAIRTALFCTSHFSKYRINQTDIDIMGGFAIKHNKGIYKLAFNSESVASHKKINRTAIPLCALEDWYILYWLIPGKQEKAVLIEDFLKLHGIKHSQLLEEGLKRPLPSEVKCRIENLLENFS